MEKKLTKSEQKIVEYIKENQEAFLFMSIGELSKVLQISEATISRFARHMGCDDFKSFKRTIVEEASNNMATKIAKTTLNSGGFQLKDWCELQKECISRTFEVLDIESYHGAVSSIVKARKVYIYGKNASGSLVKLLFFRLRRIGIDVTILPVGSSELLEAMALITEQDCVIMFSFYKLSKECKTILSWQKEVGYKTILFSSRIVQQEILKPDYTIFAYRGNREEYHSMTAPVVIIDALVISITERIGSTAGSIIKNINILKEKITE